VLEGALAPAMVSPFSPKDDVRLPFSYSQLPKLALTPLLSPV
jgi:hypothetical protein